jgi:hypothetical protein
LKPMRWFVIAPFAVAIALSFGISIGSAWAKEPPDPVPGARAKTHLWPRRSDRDRT